MIGKGAQYLTAAGFGRNRITAASLGSLDLLGTFSWLTAATKQAIMDAFGVDGLAVIAATNEYLNGIAASDKAKATALAGFINEDPMMVCSLGLEPTLTTLPSMPIRFLEVDREGAYIKTNFVPTYNMNYKLGCAFSATSGFSITGARISGTTGILIFGSGVDFFSSARHDFTAVTTLKEYKYEIVNKKFKVTDWDGTVHNEYTFSPNQSHSYPLYVFCINQAGTRNGRAGSGTNLNELYIEDLSHNPLLHMLPFKRNNELGLLDIVGDTFKTNEDSTGTFKEVFKYYNNGSWVTWTPTP